MAPKNIKKLPKWTLFSATKALALEIYSYFLLTCARIVNETTGIFQLSTPMTHQWRLKLPRFSP